MLTPIRKRAQPTEQESPDVTDISRLERSCIHYRSGRPLRLAPIIRCGRRIRTALGSAYIRQETRETYGSGTPGHSFYFQTCASIFPLPIGSPASMRVYNSIRKMGDGALPGQALTSFRTRAKPTEMEFPPPDLYFPTCALLFSLSAGLSDVSCS